MSMTDNEFKTMFGIDPNDTDAPPEMVKFLKNSHEGAKAKPMSSEEATEAITLITVTLTLMQDRSDEMKRQLRVTQEAVAHALSHTCGEDDDHGDDPFDVPDIDDSTKQRLMN